VRLTLLVIVIDVTLPQNVSISSEVEAEFNGIINGTAYLSIATSDIAGILGIFSEFSHIFQTMSTLHPTHLLVPLPWEFPSL
jgi:hypothetical protein